MSQLQQDKPPPCRTYGPYKHTVLAKSRIASYQCSISTVKSTMEQIFSLRQNLKNSHENQLNIHHHFVNYKAIRDREFAELGIPANLKKLYRTPAAPVRQEKISKNFLIPKNEASCNLPIESFLRKPGVHRNGTRLSKADQLLAYADDIDVIKRTIKPDVTAVFSAIGSAACGISDPGLQH